MQHTLRSNRGLHVFVSLLTGVENRTVLMVHYCSQAHFGALPPLLMLQVAQAQLSSTCTLEAIVRGKICLSLGHTCALGATRLYCNTPERNEQQGRSPCPSFHENNTNRYYVLRGSNFLDALLDLRSLRYYCIACQQSTRGGTHHSND
jgi:hypothetical protein